MSLNSAHWKDKHLLINNGETIKFYQTAFIEVSTDDEKIAKINGVKVGRIYITSLRVIFLNRSSDDYLKSLWFLFDNMHSLKLIESALVDEKRKNHVNFEIEALVDGKKFHKDWNGLMKLKVFLKSRRHNYELYCYLKARSDRFWSQDYNDINKTHLSSIYDEKKLQLTNRIYHATYYHLYGLRNKKQSLFHKMFYGNLLDEEPILNEIYVRDKLLLFYYDNLKVVGAFLMGNPVDDEPEEDEDDEETLLHNDISTV